MLFINTFLQQNSNVFFDLFFKYVSLVITDIPIILILSYIFWCVDKNKSFKAGVILLSGMQFNFIFKNIFRIERPYVKDNKIVNKDPDYGYGYSFPSNHTQISSTITFLIKRYFSVKKLFAYLIVFTIAVAFSRVYLGVHTVIDVFFGFLIGYLTVILMSPLVDYIMEKKKYFLLYVISVLGIISGIVMKDHDGLKIFLVYIGFITGYLFEIKHIDYKIPLKLKFKILNYILGISGVAIIYIFINNDIKYLLIGVWVSFVAPFIFKLLGKGTKYELKKD